MKRIMMDSLLEWKNKINRKPLILQGARQTGKTYLLKEFGRLYFSVTHYVNFENTPALSSIFRSSLDPINIIKELEFFLGLEIDIEKDLIVFDEIQREPAALTSLKYFCENMPRAAVCAAGSLLGVAMNIESFPVGKIQILDLKPMNFYEFLLAAEESMLAELLSEHDLVEPFPSTAHEKLFDIWKHYLVTGGLPEAVNYYRENRKNLFSALNGVREIQNQLLRAYMADISKHSGKVNSIHINQVLLSVPAQLAKSLDGSSKRYVFKDVVKDVNGYQRLANAIGWLERANIIVRVPVIEHVEIPLPARVKENFFKLYFFDAGLLGSLSELPPKVIVNYDFKTYKGFFAENFVLSEIIASGTGSVYCWQGRTSEIEFILMKDTGGIVPVEVKSGFVTQSKSLKVYCEKYNPVESIIVSARNEGKQGTRFFVPLYAAGRISSI